MKKHSLFKEGMNSYNGIEFVLNKKSIRNLIIKINSKNEIVVSVPKKVDDDFLILFLNNHLEKFNKISKTKNQNKPINLNEKWFYLFGEKVFFNIDEYNKKIIIQNKKISFSNRTIEEAINIYRKKELKVYILINQLKFQKIMNIEDHLIKIREKNTAWATNYVEKKTIYYSINLSSFSKEIIDYVIIHELSHNKFANHSRNFWNFVSEFEPNYKSKRLKLKKGIYSINSKII